MVNSHPMNQMTPAPAPHAPLRFSIFLLLPVPTSNPLYIGNILAILLIFQDVSRLAIEVLTNRFQCGEPNCLHFARFQIGHVYI